MKRILLTMGLLLLTNVEADVIDECLKENKAKSCYEAGVLYSNKNRMEEALKFYTKACNGGDSNSCSNLGLMYALGKGVEKNTKKAKEILSKDCNKDANSMACINLKYINNHNQGSYIWMHGEKGTLTSDHQPVKVHVNACEKGSARDCIEAGFSYEVGDLAKKDTKKAIGFYNKACDLNLAVGCTNTAILYIKSKKFTKSREFFKKACDKKDGRGCFGLASIYKAGLGVKQDMKKAKKLYKKACDNGDAQSCQILPFLVDIEEYKKACDNNKAEKCHDLAVMYDEGQGVATDKKKAEKLYKKACNQGVGVSCYNLGVNYGLGDGVEKNSKESIKFYTQACDKKYGAGCSNLGLEYLTGTHLKKDEKKGHNLFKKACKLNNHIGCVMLGDSYYMGTGVKKDMHKALDAYTQACNNGVAQGCSKLGVMYYYGDGVTMDKKKAQELTFKACNAGDTEACKNLNFVKREEK